jgi:uncharacterized membrane protein YccC
MQVERLAVETNAWIFVGAQQPQARSAFVHYSSETLRKDALEDTQDLVGTFANLMSDLSQAREKNALLSQRKLRAAQEEFEQYQKEAQERMAKMDAHTAYLQGLVAELQRSNNLQPQPVASGSGT